MKFLAITASNLDEFFMVRVGGLQILQKQGSTKRDPAGMTAEEQLDAISRRVKQMVADQCICLLERLQPRLQEAGIRRVRPGQLDQRQEEAVRKYFDDRVFGIFTPMAVDPTRQFPLLINQDTESMRSVEVAKRRRSLRSHPAGQNRGEIRDAAQRTWLRVHAP